MAEWGTKAAVRGVDGLLAVRTLGDGAVVEEVCCGTAGVVGILDGGKFGEAADELWGGVEIPGMVIVESSWNWYEGWLSVVTAVSVYL